MYAHVTDGAVDPLDQQPPMLHYAEGRWWDLRDRDPALLTELDWYPVVEVARPADTATETWDVSYTFDGAKVTQVWTKRAKTPQELTASQQTANESTVRTNQEQDLVEMQAIIAQSNADLRADPSQEIKLIARAIRRSIRMNLGKFDGTE